MLSVQIYQLTRHASDRLFQKLIDWILDRSFSLGINYWSFSFHWTILSFSFEILNQKKSLPWKRISKWLLAVTSSELANRINSNREYFEFNHHNENGICATIHNYSAS